MVGPSTRLQPASILSADWSKDLGKRCVYVADVAGRTVHRETARAWSLRAVLDLAARLPHPTLVGVDVALGIPAPYFAAARASATWRDSLHFLDWLSAPLASPRMFDVVRTPADWSVETPFFSVGAGEGALRAYAARTSLLRRIDERMQGKSPFLVSGIPGTVGSATRALWAELRPLLLADRSFVVWPFDGNLDSLLAARTVVVAEMYPAIAYTVALGPTLPHPRIRIGKTVHEQRTPAIRALSSTEWVIQQGVRLGDLGAADGNEDDFDAVMFAAAALRCVLEDRPLAEEADEIVEGGMLLSSLVEARRTAATLQRRLLAGAHEPTSGPIAAGAACPIAGCGHVFARGRLGWDAHVGSVRTHPDWHPAIREPTERRDRFREEFAGWLG
jgi:hypothetical protein